MRDDLLLQVQIAYSTAEEERNLLSGDVPLIVDEAVGIEPLPPGVYRVVDGQLFRVLPSLPPLPQDDPKIQ